MNKSFNEKNKEILRQIHKDAPVYVPFMLIMKKDFTINFAFYFFSYFFRFIGLFILTGSFTIEPIKIIENKVFADWARYITSYQIIKLLKISNKTYLIISFIIFVLFLIQNSLYLLKILQYYKESKEKAESHRIQIILDHLLFLFYPFLLEFLSFIFYIELLPNKFIIKNDPEMKILNIVIALINSLVLIGFNFHSYIHILSVNHSVSEENVPIKYRYPNKKFWTIFLMQNLIILECIPIYLEQTPLKTFKILIFVLLSLIFLGLFFSSLKNFNYPTIINSMVELCSYFCFFMILGTTIMTILDYNIKTYLTLLFVCLGILLISIYFQYVANIININMILNVAKEELFKINEEKINNTDIYDVFLYIQYLLKLLKFGIKDTNTQNLLNILFLHQQNCVSLECKCKLLQLVPYGKNFDKNFISNLTERISFLIESSFVQLDYSNDYNLSLLLSEHYFHSKNNSIMSFSIIQTILNSNQKKLSVKQQIILYELAEKYIKGCQKKIEDQLNSNFNKESSKIISIIQKEKGLIDSYMTLDRINKIRKKMLEYSSKYIEILKIKELIEESIKIVKDEDNGEIKFIKSGYLKTKILGNIIDILKNESSIFKSLILNIKELKGRKLPYCIYYKSFLFIDLFMGGKMEEDLIPVMYSFTNDRNLYSTEVNPTVYIILRQRYLEKFAKENSSHTIIFKYTKGMRITYFSDPLASKLGYKQKELKGENLEVLLPKSIANCHSTCVLRYLLINQNRFFSDIGNFMFDKNMQMIESHFWGVCVPGISKNLIIVISLVMREDSPYYYFLFDRNFDIISISSNYVNHYSLSVSLISKFNINLLKLFEIPKEYVRKKFNDEYDHIKEYKYRLSITAEEYFTKRLFKDKNNDIKKFGLLEYLNKNYRMNGRSEDLLKQRINKVKKDLEDMYNGAIDKNIKVKSLNLSRKKNKIIENMINTIDKFTDIDLQNMDYKKLLLSRNKLKKYEEEENVSMLNIDFDIKIFIKMLYDQETYLIKFREIVLGTKKPSELPEILTDKQIPTKNRNIKKKIPDDMSKNSIMLTNKSAHSYTGEKTKTNNSILKREKMFKTISESKGMRYYGFINYIIIGLLLIMLIVYIIILIYQNSMIENSHKIFLSLFYNYYQKDKFMNLLSPILTNAFKILYLEDESITTSDDYRMLIKNNAKEFEESYHYYYVSYVDLKTHLNEELTSIYSIKNFSKITNTFENVEYNSTFLQEVENLAFLSIYSILTQQLSIEQIRENFGIFFNGSFLYEPLIYTKITCYSIKTLYYLTKNFNSVFYKYFEEMQEEAQLKFDSYSNQSKRIYTIIEIVGFVLYSVFFGINLIYLHHTNHIIFRNIMNIFIDFTQEGPYSFKNHYDNLIIVKKINEYRAVLIDFNMKNLDKFNEKINKQNALSDSILTENFEDKSLERIDIDNNYPAGSILTPKKSPRRNNTQQTNDTKTANTNATKSYFLKLNKNNNNIISKLNEKPNKGRNNTNNTNEDKTSGNLYSKTKDFKKEIIDEELNTEIILNKTYNDGIIQIKILNIALLGLYIIIIAYFFIKLFMSLNFCSDIKRIFNDFGSITSRSSLVYYYFNSLKILLLVPKFGDPNIFKNMKNVVNQQTLEINEVLKYNIINYKNCQEAFNYFQESKSKMGDYFIHDGCKNDTLCVQVFNSSYNLYLNGLTTTLDAILLYTENLYNDCMHLKESNKYTNNEITVSLIDLDFVKIDLCLNFILNHIQDILYNSFEKDEFSIKDNYHLTINILNSCAISYSGIIGILIMIFVIRLLKLLSSNIEISGNRLNNAFCFIKEKYFRINSKSDQNLKNTTNS